MLRSFRVPLRAFISLCFLFSLLDLLTWVFLLWLSVVFTGVSNLGFVVASRFAFGASHLSSRYSFVLLSFSASFFANRVLLFIPGVRVLLVSC